MWLEHLLEASVVRAAEDHRMLVSLLPHIQWYFHMNHRADISDETIGALSGIAV
jgi:hypothetical protein